MKKTILIFLLILFIVITALTKNSTKKLENKIYSTKENISVLKNKYEYFLLDFNFLTTPEKLMEYQSKYFDNELIKVDINKVKKINIHSNKLVISNFNEDNE